MSSDIVLALLDQDIDPFVNEIELDSSGTILPVVETVRDLGTERSSATKSHCAALCKEERYIFVWNDSVKDIEATATDLENILLRSPLLSMPLNVRGAAGPSREALRRSALNVAHPTPHASHAVSDPSLYEKLNVIEAALVKEDNSAKLYDPENQKDSYFERPFLLNHALVVGLAVVLVIVVEMACIAKLIQETRLDGTYTRFALIGKLNSRLSRSRANIALSDAANLCLFFSCMFPFIDLVPRLTFLKFFMIVITGSLAQLFGPVPQTNSKFYSCKLQSPPCLIPVFNTDY